MRPLESAALFETRESARPHGRCSRVSRRTCTRQPQGVDLDETSKTCSHAQYRTAEAKRDLVDSEAVSDRRRRIGSGTPKKALRHSGGSGNRSRPTGRTIFPRLQTVASMEQV